MTTEFKVFHGVGAVIAQVTSHTKFWVLAIVNGDDKIDFSTTERMFVVDLNATPGTGQTFGASAIRFDDRGVTAEGKELPLHQSDVSFPRGRGTTLGSGALGDMAFGSFIGTVYVEHEHFKLIRKTAIDPQPWPPENSLQLYQITSVVYSLAAGNGPRSGHRYHGYRGTVTEVRDVEKEFDVVFQSQNDARMSVPITFSMDNSDLYDSDPPSEALNNAPSIAASPIRKDTQGALFVELKFAAQTGLDGGKLPIGLDDL